MILRENHFPYVSTKPMVLSLTHILKDELWTQYSLLSTVLFPDHYLLALSKIPFVISWHLTHHYLLLPCTQNLMISPHALRTITVEFQIVPAVRYGYWWEDLFKTGSTFSSPSALGGAMCLVLTTGVGAEVICVIFKMKCLKRDYMNLHPSFTYQFITATVKYGVDENWMKRVQWGDFEEPWDRRSLSS